MRAIVIEFFEGWRAEGMLVVGYKRSTRPERYAYARTVRESHKVTFAEVTFRVVAVLLDASPELKTNALEIDSFQPKYGKRMLLRTRCRGLLAYRHVVAVEARDPESAGKFTIPSMIEVRTIIEVLVGGGRFQFGLVFV